jgi:hypothetical protein
MEGIEYGYIHIESGKVVGVRYHDSPTLTAALYEASLERVLPLLTANGWKRSDANPIPATGHLRIERSVTHPPQETDKYRVAVCEIDGEGTLQERVQRIQYRWEVNGWDLIQVWEHGGLNFGPRMFFCKPRSAPDNTPFVQASLKP